MRAARLAFEASSALWQLPRSMPFKLAPQSIPNDFVWRSKYYHLTYKGHHSAAHIISMVKSRTSVPLAGWSVAQEDTAVIDSDGQVRQEGYEHTHAALMFESRLHLHGARQFDLFAEDGDDDTPVQIHPHAQPKVTIAQMEQIFLHYHPGRKFDIATGKMAFTPPISHEYSLPPEFDFTRAVMNEVVSAPSIFEACIAGQVRPRSVSDIKALRDEHSSLASKHFKHQYKKESFSLPSPTNLRALLVHGGSGLGKTKWAVAQFNNPCLIKPFDSVGCMEELCKRYDPTVHDGIVLDEADLTFLTRAQVIALVDWDEPSTLDVRYKSFTIPAGVPKILISNPGPEEILPKDPHGAIARRLRVLHVMYPTWAQGRHMNDAGCTPATAPNGVQNLLIGPTPPPTVPSPIMAWNAAPTP